MLLVIPTAYGLSPSSLLAWLTDFHDLTRLMPPNLNYALATGVILYVSSTWHAIVLVYLRAFPYAVPAAWKALPMFVHLSPHIHTSRPTQAALSPSFLSTSSLLNNPTLCSLSTFCIFYHIILKLSIYLSGFLISSWRAQTIWTHIAIVVSIFHLIQTSYNFVLSIWVFTFYVTVVSPSWGWKPIKG